MRKIAVAAAAVALSALAGCAVSAPASAFFPGQQACCGPSSMYNEDNSSPLQFQEDNATRQACCGLGSQYEIDRAWQEEQQQQFMDQSQPQTCFGVDCQ